MSDFFHDKNISPMLITENKLPFDSPDYFYELKWDGIRCLVYMDENEGTELRNKRNKRLNATYPELNAIHKNISRRCILDGELIATKDGKPDFYEIQRRSLMSDPFKIELSSKKQPISFIAYDVLYIGSEAIINHPLSCRMETLYEVVTETPSLILSRSIEQNGITLFEATKAQGLEGIIAKRKDSLYFPGKRTKDWVKIKNLQDEDFIVCGFYKNEGNVASVIIGAYENGKIIYQGHVALGVSQHDYKLMEQSERADAQARKIYYHSFPDFPNAVWLLPRLVCSVKYMERTKNGGLRQPVFRGVRGDKLPEDCVSIFTNAIKIGGHNYW